MVFKRLTLTLVVFTVAGCSANGYSPNVSQTKGSSAAVREAAAPASSSGFQVLHMFQGPPNDGWVPHGLIPDANGTLYGETFYGGGKHPNGCQNGCGTVYVVSPAGDTILHSFGSFPGDGASPIGRLLPVNGVFYGVTQVKGTAGDGTIFELSPSPRNPNKWIETVIYNFQGPPADGSDPDGVLVRDASGALYGTTFMGGSGTTCLFKTDGCGTVFKLTPPASSSGSWRESVIHSFTGSPDGAAPGADLVLGSGNTLYGVTNYGGTSTQCPGLQGCGTLFRLSKGKHAWTATVLHSFNVDSSKSDGSLPGRLVGGANGVLYGTTAYGGGAGNCNVEKGLTYCGTVYSFVPAPSRNAPPGETILYAFKGAPTDGAQPYGLIADGKRGFYGTTAEGGNGPCQAYEGCGTVYALTPPAHGKTSWNETMLHSFEDTDGDDPSDGLVLQNGTLYGTTGYGGTGPCSFGCGTIFEVLDVSAHRRR
ncbi:MAG: choice-of-anchor tandem repeat GloVer-containing protein [Candidatus Tumulicola sp.]